MISELDPIVAVPPEPPRDAVQADHPMRHVTRQIAFEPESWDPARRAKVGQLFDELAPGWPVGDEIKVAEPLVDAFDRGVAMAPPAHRVRLVDLGGGNGRATRVMVDRIPGTIIIDLSLEMLLRVPAGLAPKVQADGSQLPIPDGAIDVLVCTNMFLFPTEAARVLGSLGVLVWVNSWGPATPIHLSAAEVDQVLPEEWSGVSSRAGEATWSVHWRADDPHE